MPSNPYRFTGPELEALRGLRHGDAQRWGFEDPYWDRLKLHRLVVRDADNEKWKLTPLGERYNID